MRAILNGISMFHSTRNINNITSWELVIITDSAYIYNCYAQKWYEKWLNNGWQTSKHEPVLNKELWQQLIPYFKDSKYKFEKTKGHADDERNNFVDQLAVAAKENKWLE